MATRVSEPAKRQITKILNNEGYSPYAKLLQLFDIYLSDNKDVIAYCVLGKRKIVVNEELDNQMVSVVVRHEILHEYLNHYNRRKMFEEQHSNLISNSMISNIAADFEISNVGYTDNDKGLMRVLKVGDKILGALVTEDKYPDWTEKSYEEMYELLLKENQETLKKLQQIIEMLSMKDDDDLDYDDSNLSEEEKQVIKEMHEMIKDEIEKQKKEKKDIKELLRHKKQKEKLKLIKEVSDRITSGGLHQFKLRLNNFISWQLDEIEDESYSTINPTYEDSEFLLPGVIKREHKKIPIINVYHDVSGSFSDPKKTEGANKAIATLNKYVENGDIEIHRYYHADRVASTREEAGLCNNGDLVMEHILATKPDNVIIITDGDLSDTTTEVEVPGAVWMLFYDYQSEGLIKCLKGKKETRCFDIDY